MSPPSRGRTSRPRGNAGPWLTLPDVPVPSAAVARRLRAARQDDWDFLDGRIFGSMCTEPLPEAVRAALPFVSANLGNPGLAPGTAALEEELMAMLLELYHGPRFGGGGWLVSGGTEANLTALWIARNFTGGREVVLPESAHFSFVKALDLLRLEPRWVPVDEAGRTRLSAFEAALGPRTACAVGVAGSTELGAVDPLAEMAALTVDRRVPFHVDAAFGGFVLPWVPRDRGPPLPFDFALEGVSSLAVDPHKMGLAPVPSGALLLRRVETASAIQVASPYLSSPQATGLLGTRASHAVAATYTAMLRTGRSGYRRTVERCLELTDELVAGARRLGLRPAAGPTLNLVTFHHRQPSSVQAWMLERGWDVSQVHRPSGVRFVVMPHITERSLRAMLKDLAGALRAFPA